MISSFCSETFIGEESISASRKWFEGMTDAHWHEF